MKPTKTNNVLKRIVARQQLDRLVRPYLILMLGEKPNWIGSGKPPPRIVPFCSNKNSSGWLNEQLDNEEIPEELLVWRNVIDNENQILPYSVLDELKPRAIVCLGGKAADWVKNSGTTIQSFKTYHPQYWKRFKSKERYPLLEILQLFS